MTPKEKAIPDQTIQGTYSSKQHSCVEEQMLFPRRIREITVAS